MKDIIYADWNPWHGCTKISPGCKFCYVYRQDEMYGNPTASSRCTKNAAFDLPVQRGRGGSYKIPPGRIILTCFTSDFLLKDADPWRQDCWRMIRERTDCWFYFFTKRIDRLAECLPPDWGEGYDNVMIGCTVENQERADFRLPIFLSLPIKHRSVIVAPMLERVDLSKWLGSGIEEVFRRRGIGSACPSLRLRLDTRPAAAVRGKQRAVQLPPDRRAFHQGRQTVQHRAEIPEGSGAESRK